MRLSEVWIGAKMVIERVDLAQNLREYAESRGIFAGNEIRVLLRSCGRAMVQIDGCVFILPRMFCEKIEVKSI